MTNQVVIENPIINSPFNAPNRHFRFTDDGITNEIIDTRRKSAYFIPVPRSKKKSEAGTFFDSEWTEDRIQENDFINKVRARVDLWRSRGRPGLTKVTAKLIDYWTNPDREKRLFFCQIEALETAIYIAEVANKQGDQWIANRLQEENEKSNPLLYRIALKMATGTGKTVVMAMLIAWQVLNRLDNKRSAIYSDCFLVVTPGITIRDRLRVLLPNDPENYYQKHDLIPMDLLREMGKARIVITNFHQFKCRELVKVGKLNKTLLQGKSEAPSPFTETPAQMVRRICREFGNKTDIVVINDEAHHCYRRKPEEDMVLEPLKGEERKAAEKRDEDARVWISGLEAVKKKVGVRSIYDLSATPFFLKGSGFSEGTLFPWVVADFSLIDAIESGIVKVPRVPVSDNSMTGEMPTYRNLWYRIRDKLPKKGRGTAVYTGEPQLPPELEGALHSLYGNYETYYRRWEEDKDAQAKGQTPPVFIVVCNNTNVSKMIFDYVSGYEKEIAENQKVVAPGRLGIFNNEANGSWALNPNTILVDSEQLESGEGMKDDFKQIARAEIEEFKHDYRKRFPDRDVDKLTDEDLLREVMNTVGKKGKLGENIKCVVSVSMLTEGWDANTVTHILGVRAFGTQLLCEQVVGRGLRRMSYAVNAEGRFDPEYAEVYGVPFSFIPCSGSSTVIVPGPMPTRVRALEDRNDRLITFPRVAGYKYDMPAEILTATFTDDSRMAISTQEVPTKIEVDPLVGEKTVHTLDDLKKHRLNEVAFCLAKRVLDKYFPPGEENCGPWLYPKILHNVKRWLSECLYCKDNAFSQMLLIATYSHDAADRIYRAIIRAEQGEKRLKPILQPYDQEGSTRHVDFDTRRPTYATRADKCHVSHVVADTGSWEQKLAQSLEDMPEVYSYVKNQNVGFTIPYTLNGQEHNYIPDFIVRIDDGHGPQDLLNLIIEITGERKKDKAAKVETAQTLWIPAVNNHGGFGRWAFIEILDPWDAQNTIRENIKKV